MRGTTFICSGLSALFAVSTCASPAAAQPAESPYPRAGAFSPLDPFHAGFGIGSGIGWVTEETARENLVGNWGPTIHLDIDADLFDLFTLGGSLGTTFLPDNGSFRQWVIDTEGIVSNAESSLNLTIASLFVGLRTPDFCLAADQQAREGWLASYGFVHFGRSWFGGARTIDNCSDCDVRKLEFANGSFVEPGASIGIKANDGFGMSLSTSYRRYLSGAAALAEWRIGYTITYW